MLFVSRVCGHSFLPGLFGGEPVVLDAGFNRGEFSRAMMDIYDATAFAVEPSRRLFDARPVCPRLHVWQVALGGREGRTALHVYKDRDATLLDAVTFGEKIREEVVTVWTLGTFLAETGLQTADLLKVVPGACAAENSCKKVSRFQSVFACESALQAGIAGRVTNGSTARSVSVRVFDGLRWGDR